MTSAASPFASLTLRRLPHNDKLQAWDAADTLLLEHYLATNDSNVVAGSRRVLLLNDAFGALACGLPASTEIVSWSDSWLAHQASISNLNANRQADSQAPSVSALKSTELPTGEFSAVLIKIPKTLALLEQQLQALRPLLRADTQVIAAGMVKHIHNSTLALFERIIGPSPTSLAKRKARLVFPELNPSLTTSPPPGPTVWRENGLTVSNLANVFSREKFDLGARFMIEQFAKLPAAQRVIDLGCGNGVLAIAAARQLPEARFLLLDESYMAVASAEQNYQNNIGDDRAECRVSDCLSQAKDWPAELILCNPPFHQQHAVGDQIAWQMFRQSQRQLSRSGELWVVGNRHLHYHEKLRRLFGGCRSIASNNKFVVLAARKN